MAIEANNGQTDSGTAKDRLLRDPVPGKARSPLGAIAGGFFQVAFCTTNLDSFLQTLSDDLGVDRFFIIRDAQVTDQTFRGQPCDARQDLAFGYAGSLQFEIIQPLSGESSYSEFLAAHPEGACTILASSSMTTTKPSPNYPRRTRRYKPAGLVTRGSLTSTKSERLASTSRSCN
jgi:hypothetical protein